jgi:hypothetical protein
MASAYSGAKLRRAIEWFWDLFFEVPILKDGELLTVVM